MNSKGRKIGIEFYGKNSIRMDFINGSVGLPPYPGGYVVASGCGSGKTTVIKDIIRQKYDEGILYAASTIDEIDSMYEWLINNVVGRHQPEHDASHPVLNADDIIVLHSKNENSKYVYRYTPEDISNKKVVLCTHYKLLHDDPRLLISQNFRKEVYNDYKLSLTRIAVNNRVANNTVIIPPRQWVLVDEMPVCDQLKMYFDKSTKLSLVNKVAESEYKYNSVINDYQCVSAKFKYEPYSDRAQLELAYNTLIKNSKLDPFPKSANYSENVPGRSVPMIMRKDLVMSSFMESYAAEICGLANDDPDKVIDGYVRYGITDLILDSMNTRVIVFDGTGDLTFGSENTKFNLRDIKNKYNSPCHFHKIDNIISRKYRESYLLDYGNKIYEIIDKCCHQLKDIIEENEKTLIITWKNLKIISPDTRKKSSFKISKGRYNDSFSLPNYITNELNKLNLTKEFSVIHYQSGLDKATNQFREYDAVVFLGEFHVPNSVVKDFNDAYSANSNLFRYTLYQMVQTICRTRIRMHQGQPINIYLTDDWDDRLIAALHVYLNNNNLDDAKMIETEKHNTLNPVVLGSLADERLVRITDKWRDDIDKLDSTIMPGLLNNINNHNEVTYEVELDDIYKLLPRSRKVADRYYSLISYLDKLGIKLVINNNKHLIE